MAAAAAAVSTPPHSTLASATLLDSAGELEESKTMSLSNLRQL
jgi:hypothetical protein